jgi:hypothetical protein
LQNLIETLIINNIKIVACTTLNSGLGARRGRSERGFPFQQKVNQSLIVIRLYLRSVMAESNARML